SGTSASRACWAGTGSYRSPTWEARRCTFHFRLTSMLRRLPQVPVLRWAAVQLGMKVRGEDLRCLRGALLVLRTPAKLGFCTRPLTKVTLITTAFSPAFSTASPRVSLCKLTTPGQNA